MSDIHIHRPHQLGLPEARKVALQWVEKAKKKLDLQCTFVEGETSDTVAFTGSGVTGKLRVEADQFKVDAKLGFVLAMFSASIEAEIAKNLDALLAKAVAASPAVEKGTGTQP